MVRAMPLTNKETAMSEPMRRTITFDPETDAQCGELALHLGITRSQATAVGIALAHAAATQLDLESDQAAHELGDRLPSMRKKIAAREGEVRAALRPPTSSLRQSMN